MPEPTDPRRYRAETERNLLIAVVALLVIVGGGLIAIFYGAGAAFIGLWCIAGGIILLLTLYLLLKLFERIGGE